MAKENKQLEEDKTQEPKQVTPMTLQQEYASIAWTHPLLYRKVAELENANNVLVEKINKLYKVIERLA